MHPQLLKRLDEIDALLESKLQQLSQYPDEHLNRAPGPGKWSALQCFHHVLQSETLSLKYIKKKLSFNPELKPRNLNTTFRTWLLVGYLRAPIKFKAPKGVSTENFPATSSFQVLADQYRKSRSELRDYIANLPDEIYQKEVYKHPFAGRLPVDEMLLFFKEHFNRHQKQAFKALKSP